MLAKIITHWYCTG